MEEKEAKVPMTPFQGALSKVNLAKLLEDNPSAERIDVLARVAEERPDLLIPGASLKAQTFTQTERDKVLLIAA